MGIVLPQRVFSLEDANQALPSIRLLFSSFFALRSRLGTLAEDTELLFDIWGDDVWRKGNIDHSFFMLKERKKQETVVQMKTVAGRIIATGVVVKDINAGLIDFYGEWNGKRVFFCWRYGEETVSHWHPLNEGFDSRRELDTVTI